MQLASDPAAKPPPPDCVFVAAPAVPSAVCLFPLNPVSSSRTAMLYRVPVCGSTGERSFGGSNTRTEHMNMLRAGAFQPVAACGNELLNLRNSLAAACRSLG